MTGLASQGAGSLGIVRPTPWTIGMILLLLVVVPVLQTALAGRNPWLNQLAAGGSRNAFWVLIALTMLYQWLLVAGASQALRVDGLSWRDAGLLGVPWRPYVVALTLVTLGFVLAILARPGGMFSLSGGAAPRGALAAFLPTTGAERLTWLLLSLSAAVTEEYLYRGFLISRLGAWMQGRVGLAFLLSCVAFGLAHNGWAQSARGLIMRTVLGAILGALFLWKRSILPSVVLHYLSNAVAALTAVP